RSGASHPPASPPLAWTPDEPREGRTRYSHFLWCVLSEILARECCGVAPCWQAFGGPNVSWAEIGVGVALFSALWRGNGVPKNRAEALFHRCLCLRLAVTQDLGPAIMPERLEGTIEDRQVFVPMDEQRAAGVVDLV